MKTLTIDLLAIAIIGIGLLVLSEMEKLDLLMELPFITIYASYILGRLAGEYGRKNKRNQEAATEV